MKPQSAFALVYETGQNFPIKKSGMANGHTAFINSSYLVGYIRQKRHNPCTLDRDRKLSLVLCTCAGSASRHDLAALRDKLPQFCNVFVIYCFRLIRAEHTNFPSRASCTHRSSCSFFTHCEILLYSRIRKAVPHHQAAGNQKALPQTGRLHSAAVAPAAGRNRPGRFPGSRTCYSKIQLHPR